MIRKKSDSTLVVFSTRAYQLFLNAYPTKFQQEYGSHMVQVFRDCCLRMFNQSWTYGILKLWAITFIDLISSALAEHLQKENEMTKLKFIKLSGWAFIVGSFAFMTILSGSIAGSVIGSNLIAIGMLGLRARYSESVGSFGKNFLLVGVVGMVLAYAAVPIFREVEILYLLPFDGPAVLFTGLTVFGLVALGRKPLPQANWLPLIAGIWYPAIYFSIFVYILLNNGAWPESDFPYIPIQIMVSVQFIALCVLGAILVLQTDVAEETPATA